ncbi:hypothetical protein RND71_027761 [Anisodus tanguticus]|uniref:GH10 domain-containing protein n=1 Tax=Anisodus tanguticus TaxID=243964 RepID=A0AAE1RIH0_9SOLA|nr:hypothetical protein RND71_027761 [Anisodus tanguticus]
MEKSPTITANSNFDSQLRLCSVKATDKDWVALQGKFLLNDSPSQAVVFLEGPPPGLDILLNNLVIKHAAKAPPSTPPVIEDAGFGVNIITNRSLNDGTNSWFPLGNCTMISDEVKLYLTYQVSAWVKTGQSSGPHNVNVALGVDSQWVNGGQVEISDDRWHEIGGSFRTEKQATKVMVYIQGPAAGVDLMVAGLQIFPVDRRARFRHLKRQTAKIRKRDIMLKFSGSDSGSLLGTFVRVRQLENSFPFGAAISRTNMDNEDFNAFFVKNFNWAVFGNELKCYWTEAQKGNLNYKDADELLDFCTKNNIQVRDLLKRYKGKFPHYDVNNEMMHGSFYQDRLGKDIRVNMFKIAHQLDHSPTLFVNDCHVEDGCDTRSSPEKYIEHILDLQEHSAPVGGIGIQGHIGSPVGSIVCSALDKLGILGLPIWFTEVDVSFDNEYIRADDLEVLLREAYAHPAVEEGDINEAGKRYLALKREWLSHAHGHIDEQGQFGFSGVHGSYEVEVIIVSKKITKKFVVDKGIQGHIDSPVGPIICSALDKLGMLVLPIWFTEVDVSDNEYIRADDLEVMLREAYAHPDVEGIMFVGILELFNSRQNAHLVNAEGDLNEAGKRYLALKHEWLSHAHGHIDEQGQFSFSGFHGSYEVEVITVSKKITKKFVVDKGDDALVIIV